MPDRERQLERELMELGTLIDYPPTPDVARAARSLLDEEREDRPRRFRVSIPALRWAAVAAAFVLVVAVPILSPSLRATVSDWFVAENTSTVGGPAVDAGASKRHSEQKAPPSGVSKGGEAVTSSGRTPRFPGERITPREARMKGVLLLPRTPTLGKPDDVYAFRTPRKDGIVLVYREGLPPLGDTGISLLLTEVPGDVAPTYLAGNGSKLDRVMVDGRPGYWGPAGSLPSQVELPFPGRVLLWKQGGVALRLEADLPKDRAIRIAESVR
jgi:hypothetical protein